MILKKLRKQGNNWFEVTFSYKRIPIICYLYGIIGHDESNYLKVISYRIGNTTYEWLEEIKLEIKAHSRMGKNP